MLLAQSIEPSAVLRPYIKFYFSLEYSNEISPYRITPDGCIEVIFNLDKPLTRLEEDGNASKLSNYVVTRFSKHYFISHSGSARMIGIQFYPWGLRPFIRLPLLEIADNNFSQEDIFGGSIKKVHEQIANAKTAEEIIKFIEKYLINKLRSDSDDIIVADAAKRIINSKGCAKISDLLNSYNISMRTMEKRFKNTIGVSAKLYSRVIKFQHALKHLQSGSLTGTAYKVNYFDQAHFIHEFKFFAGVSPKKYLAQDNTINHLISSTSFLYF